MPELLAFLEVPGLVGPEGGEAGAGVLGGEVVGRLPDEVGEVAVGELPEHGVVHVGAELESVVGAGEAGPGARRLVGLAVLQDVGELVADPRQAQGATTGTCTGVADGVFMTDLG